MSFSAKVICDSISPSGRRLTTVAAKYPLAVHGEMLTHRAFARNAASNRAIPFAKMLSMVTSDPFIPLEWGREQSGMQMGEPIPKALEVWARALWNKGLDHIREIASMIHNIGESYEAMIKESCPNHDVQMCESFRGIKIHKSLPNRLLMPFQYITTIITATEWQNFFRLRCHRDAEIHMRTIAEMIRDAIKASTPKQLQVGEWHQPFVRGYDEDELSQRYSVLEMNQISTARVARVSYLTHEGKKDPVKDLATYQKLLHGSDDIGHFSPFESVAECHADPDHRSGPFRGWAQFRKQFANENVEG